MKGGLHHVARERLRPDDAVQKPQLEIAHELRRGLIGLEIASGGIDGVHTHDGLADLPPRRGTIVVQPLLMRHLPAAGCAPAIDMIDEDIAGDFLLIGHGHTPVRRGLKPQYHDLIQRSSGFVRQVVEVALSLPVLLIALNGPEQRVDIGFKRVGHGPFAVLIVAEIKRGVTRIPADKIHAVFLKALTLHQPSERAVRLGRGQAADRRGASIIDKAPPELEGKANVLCGNQLGVALNLGMVFHGGQLKPCHIAQLRPLSSHGRKLLFPAAAHIRPHPEPVFGIRVFDAEAGEALRVRTVALCVVFVLIVFELKTGNGSQIGVKRFLFQIVEQNAQAVRRVLCGAPRFQLRDIAVKILAVIACNQVFQLLGQRERRTF